MLRLIKTTAGRLVFSLLCGLSYFLVLLPPITRFSGGNSLLAVFFSPLIVCGAALIVIKSVKRAEEEENDAVIIRLAVLHAVLLAIGIVFTAAMFV